MILIEQTSIDCRDAYALSQWWRAALGYEMDPQDPNEPGHEECLIRDPATGHTLLFLEVPEGKAGKNRLHFDVVPRVGTRDEELPVLLALGASVVTDHRGIHGPGTGWVILADPEGNEFCLCRSAAEKAGNIAAAGDTNRA